MIYSATVAGLRRKQLHHEIPRTFYTTESERWNDMSSHVKQKLEISNFSEEDTIRLAPAEWKHHVPELNQDVSLWLLQ
jgi:hypothetical protein